MAHRIIQLGSLADSARIGFHPTKVLLIGFDLLLKSSSAYCEFECKVLSWIDSLLQSFYIPGIMTPG